MESHSSEKPTGGELPQYLIADDHEPIITREEVGCPPDLCEYRRERQCGGYQRISESICIQQPDCLRGVWDKFPQAENLHRKTI